MPKKQIFLGAVLSIATTALMPMTTNAQISDNSNNGISSFKLCKPGDANCPTIPKNGKWEAPRQLVPSDVFENKPGKLDNSGKTNRLPRAKPPARKIVTCSEAKQIVREAGFRKVKAMFCAGSHYSFRARNKGKHYFVVVRKKGGEIVSTSTL